MLSFTDWTFPKKNVKHVTNQSFQLLAKSRGLQLVAKTIGLQLIVAKTLGLWDFKHEVSCQYSKKIYCQII